jgi:uncharacterized protein YcbX
MPGPLGPLHDAPLRPYGCHRSASLLSIDPDAREVEACACTVPGVARLARINTTSVKGTALANPTVVELTSDGIPGNRRFHLADADGRHVGAFDVGSLVQVRCVLDPSSWVLRCGFPDGTTVEGHQDDLGESVLTEMDDHSTPGRVVRGSFAASFSSFLGRDVRLIRADRDVDGNDVEPVTLVSNASVRDLALRGGRRGDLDVRRFRMNLELDDTEPYEEDTWHGARVQVGDAVLRIGGQVPRCRVTTYDPDTGERDFPTLKTIASYRPLRAEGRGIPFGMYATVERPGVARVGDAVIPLPDG